MNDNCPICLESLTDNTHPLESITLSCHHVVHTECTQQLIRPNCPLCNQLVLNFPRDLLERIDENAKRYRDEVEQDNLRELLRSFERESAEQYSAEAFTASPHLQAFYAIAWLREHGIPFSRIPDHLTVEMDEASRVLASQPYAIFHAIISLVINELSHELTDGGGSTISEMEEYLERAYTRLSLDSDDITDEDDELFRTQGADIERSIEVRRPTDHTVIRFKLEDIPPLPDDEVEEIDDYV